MQAKLLACILLLSSGRTIAQKLNPLMALDKHNLTWSTPGISAKSSMPIGNGDVGANVWTEADGSINFYISKTAAFSEFNQLLKVGKLKVLVSPNPFQKTEVFKQVLNFRNGEILIEGDGGFACRIWMDANRPSLNTEMRSDKLFTTSVSNIVWRKESRELTTPERHTVYGYNEYPGKVYVYPDTIFSGSKHELLWCHRNRTSIWRSTFENQDIGHLTDKLEDPLLNRTFGGLVKGSGLVKLNDTTLHSSKPALKQEISVSIYCSQTPDIEQWVKSIDSVSNINSKHAYAEHVSWWNAFWKKSYVFVSGTAEAETVTKAYISQKYVMACSNRGKLPPKFNGSLFNVDMAENLFGKAENFNADYRRWGGCYWFQNMRLMYWAMLATGDFEPMKTFFKMYTDAMPLAEARTQVYFKHSGIMFPETMTFWGTYAQDDYGWDRTNDSTGHVDSPYIRFYFQNVIEQSAIMLEYYQYTEDETYFHQHLLPFINGTLDFYKFHYPIIDNQLRIAPAQSLETYWEVVNPTPEVAGLTWVIQQLLNVKSVSGKQVEGYQAFLKQIPAIPLADSSSGKVIAPAEGILSSEITNSENPELYAVFPYRMYGVEKSDIEMARRTFALRKFKGHTGWRQDPIQAALLGLTDEAKKMLVEMTKVTNAEFKFPAFWGPNFDWLPDQDHGSVIMLTLHAMLMQNAGDRILTTPAFPKDWNAEFRLFTTGNKVVNGSYQKGKVKSWKVR